MARKEQDWTSMFKPNPVVCVLRTVCMKPPDCSTMCCLHCVEQVWAFLEYMDDVLGRLFDYMDESPLRDNTYIMMMSDNGAELFPTERRGKDKLVSDSGGLCGGSA